jgi:hypothetical protein
LSTSEKLSQHPSGCIFPGKGHPRRSVSQSIGLLHGLFEEEICLAIAIKILRTTAINYGLFPGVQSAKITEKEPGFLFAFRPISGVEPVLVVPEFRTD